jgi:hypothetical protein
LKASTTSKFLPNQHETTSRNVTTSKFPHNLELNALDDATMSESLPNSDENSKGEKQNLSKASNQNRF